MDSEKPTTIPHSSFGDAEWCGCLTAIIHGDQAEITCNECEAVIITVPVSDLDHTFREMALNNPTCFAVCSHCKSENAFPGFTRIDAFVCHHCGEV